MRRVVGSLTGAVSNSSFSIGYRFLARTDFKAKAWAARLRLPTDLGGTDRDAEHAGIPTKPSHGRAQRLAHRPQAEGPNRVPIRRIRISRSTVTNRIRGFTLFSSLVASSLVPDVPSHLIRDGYGSAVLGLRERHSSHSKNPFRPSRFFVSAPFVGNQGWDPLGLAVSACASRSIGRGSSRSR